MLNKTKEPRIWRCTDGNAVGRAASAGFFSRKFDLSPRCPHAPNQNKHGIPTGDIMSRLARDFVISLWRKGSHKQTHRSIAEKEASITAFFDGGELTVRGTTQRTCGRQCSSKRGVGRALLMRPPAHRG